LVDDIDAGRWLALVIDGWRLHCLPTIPSSYRHASTTKHTVC